MVLVVLADVGMRAIIATPLPWAHEVLGMLLLALFFLGMPTLVLRQELLVVDFIARRCGVMMERLLLALSQIMLLLFALALSWMGLVASREMYYYQEVSFQLAIPFWPFAVLVATSGGLVAMLSLIKLLQAFRASVPKGLKS